MADLEKLRKQVDIAKENHSRWIQIETAELDELLRRLGSAGQGEHVCDSHCFHYCAGPSEGVEG